MYGLQELYDALLSEAEDRIAEVAYGPNADRAATPYEALVDALQGLAISYLLLDYDADTFRANLIHAAGARRQLLQVCLRDDAQPVHCALSRTDALFCALAARDETLASELVRLGPTEWMPEGEYEEDFCYHAVLSHLIAPHRADGLPPLNTLMERFEAALDGISSARMDVCKALLSDDASAFLKAFEDRLVEHDTWGREMYEARRDQPLFLVARHVFVEGLALLVLAEKRGWDMPDAYAFCPEPGRLAPVSPLPEDLFIDVVPLLRESRRQRGLPT